MTPQSAADVSAPEAFDACGPLPSDGTWILEASAGTGKTYTIAALAARYVAGGVALQNIMMVTFSRAATRELRDRIRARLVDTEGGLRRALAGDPLGDDEVTRLLTTGSGDELRVRLARVTAALADFDSATIATTHEFCGRMLDGLGILADLDPLAHHVESLDDLVREAAADLWLRVYASATERSGPEITWAAALPLARAIGDNRLPLLPDAPGLERHLQFANALRRTVAQRKREQGLTTYDDLLHDLDRLLDGRRPGASDPADPALGDAVRARLRERFPIVLIDEFQDTDPVQWSIVRKAFVGHSTLVLIGDPKQAIYGFRDADVECYLDAVTSVEGAHHRTLPRNWRSDPGVVDALWALLGNAELGHERITVREVDAAHTTSRLTMPDQALAFPLRIRRVPIIDPEQSQSAATLRDAINADLVADIAAVLHSGATLELDGRTRPVRPGDIAVLVGANKKAEAIREALTAAGIPAVHTGANSVFATAEARDWQTLLQAFESGRSEHVRAVALTAFVGWTFTRLATAGDVELNELSATVRRWGRAFDDHGIAGLTEAMDHDGLAVRLLAEVGGERRYTDLRHLGQSLHVARTRHGLGVAGLVEWLRARRTEAASSDDDRTRRLETDDDAVRVMTVHASKGLEFPFVYLPDRWDHWEAKEPQPGPIRQRTDRTRTLWIATDDHSRHEAHASALADSRDEALRLLYVALTRAQCQVVTWWAGNASNTPGSAFHRVLQRTEPRPATRYNWQCQPERDRFPAALVDVRDIGHLAPAPAAPAGPPAHLGVRGFDRPVDTQWRRTSYSGLTALAHEQAHGAAAELGDDELAGVGDEPVEVTDESLPTLRPLVEEEADRGVANTLVEPSPMADLPRGAAFGTLVHAVYETFDPAAPDLAAELAGVCAQWLQRLPSGVGGGGELTATALGGALLPSVLTPLGPIADGLRLCDIPATDRLVELDFEYPLAGGETPRGRASATLARVADLLDDHLDPADPLSAYSTHLRDPLLAPQQLRGYLVGSIDAVLRVPQGSGHRYLVVDYKTNWLGPLESDEPLTVAHYTPRRMAQAMMDAHYPLQALLYCVALHRFLRWRQPAYDPAAHLGGVAYLFVRGMAGPDTPVVEQGSTVRGTPCGVFAWRPPVGLVLALSDLIDGTTESEADR